MSSLATRFKLLDRAIVVLRQSESDALIRMTEEKMPENRALFREVHETLVAVEADLHRRRGLFSQIATFLTGRR